MPSEVVEHLLPNGLKVLLKEVHSAPVVSSYIWYKVGARNERTGITGISHWIEHMLFKGTPKFPRERLKRLIEGNGGRWNAFTSTDYTAYFELLPADKIDIALALEADRMQNSSFDREEVELERTVILSERSGLENSPQFQLCEEIQATAYKIHPYHWGIIGWASDLKTMTRDDLYTYYQEKYVPNNATLVIVGDFDTSQLLQKIEAHFGELAPGKPIEELSIAEPKQLGEKRVTVRKAGNLAQVAIAYHIPEAGHDDLYALDLLSTIMASGKTSRFYKALVDRQLATHADFDPTFSKSPGLAWLSAEACAGVSPETIEAALTEEVDRVCENLVTEIELKTAKRKTSANFIFSLDSVSSQAGQLGYFETLTSHKFLDTYIDRIEGIEAAEIREIARKYLQKDNRTVGHFQPI